MRSNVGLLLVILGVLLVIGGLAFAGYNLYTDYAAGEYAEQATQELWAVIQQKSPEIGQARYQQDNEEQPVPQAPSVMGAALAVLQSILDDEKPAPTAAPQQAVSAPAESQVQMVLPEAAPQEEDLLLVPDPDEVEIPDYQLNPNMDMPVSRQNGQDYIGILEVPSLGLELPVISQWNYTRLKKAPCRYVGSAYLDNMVIAAHNYEKHFGRLNELPLGSRVIFTDTVGNQFVYEVVLKDTLGPKAIEEMTSGEFDLTLFTCTPGGSHRVTIRCDKVE